MEITVLAAVIALVAGFAAGWFARTARSAEQVAEARTRAASAEAVAAGLRDQREHERALDDEREARLRSEHSVLQALAPVRETLETMQRQVVSLERERDQQYGAIQAQLRQAREADEQLRRTTESLSGALRGTATRGVWGETALRRVVEAAGLTRHVDFTTQTTVSAADGTGRPDMVIRLPGDKAIPVDAKVPLDAYLQACAIPDSAVGADQERRSALMSAHVRALRAHVSALAKKSYWTGLAASPEFVICFLPNESLLSSALDEDPALLDYAFAKRVALASPVNLWAVLKTVAFTWTQQDVSDEARRLFELGTTLYERLGSLSGHADSLRRAIERTVDSYNKLVGSLESRVLVTARQFPGIDETKLLPSAEPISAAPRGLSAAEFTDDPDSARRVPAPTEFDEVRARIQDSGVADPEESTLR